MLSPEGILARAPRAFSQTSDTGEARVVEARPRHVRVAFSGCEGFDPWLWENLVGASSAQLELGGAKRVEVRLEGGGSSPEMLFDARWT